MEAGGSQARFLSFAVLVFAGSLAAQQWTPPSQPAIDLWVGTYDAHRDRFVRFGPSDGETWENNAGHWRKQVTGTPPFGAPVARRNATFVADPVRHRVYMFGGELTSGQALADMWAYDGLDWSSVLYSVGPSRRAGAIATFDSARGRVVMFGGQDAGTVTTQTWEYDGTLWNQTATGGPTWSTSARIAFDSARARTVVLANATYTYDGVAWTNRATSATTPLTVMAEDPLRQRVVAYRGDAVPAVLEWNGTTWQSITVTGLQLSPANAWFDPAAGKVLVADPGAGGTRFAWDGAALTPTGFYPEASSRAFFVDTARNQLVVFSGVQASLLSADTWSNDGTGWTRLSPAAHPIARTSSVSTFDSARGVGLVFGGASDQGLVGDLWSWNGTNWSQLSITGPSARILSTMTFDSARGRAVLFGGMSLTGVQSDTWEWDGVAWTQLQPVNRPPAGFGTLGYDPQRQRSVYYQPTLNQNRVWEWDGVNWTSVTTTAAPPAIAPVALAFDPLRNRIAAVASAPGYGVWEYDGVNWAQRSGIAAAEFVGVQQLAWDATHQRLVAIDDRGLIELVSTVADDTYYATSCGPTATVLMTRNPARIGSGGFGFDVSVDAGAATLFALSAAQGSTPLAGGCTLHLGAFVFENLTVADARGLASWLLPIPPSSALVGVQAYAQAGSLTASGTLRASQGIQLRIGD